MLIDILRNSIFRKLHTVYVIAITLSGVCIIHHTLLCVCHVVRDYGNWNKKKFGMASDIVFIQNFVKIGETIQTLKKE
jgi:hypothetical protein